MRDIIMPYSTLNELVQRIFSEEIMDDSADGDYCNNSTVICKIHMSLAAI